MAHWSQTYIGLPYVEKENDCAAFAAKVQREVFARDIRLPTAREKTYRGMSAQIEECKDDYAVPTLSPVDGDAVLMIGRGYLNHVGVYCVIGGAAYVLHAMKNAGQVVLHRADILTRFGLCIEGYYQWT